MKTFGLAILGLFLGTATPLQSEDVIQLHSGNAVKGDLFSFNEDGTSLRIRVRFDGLRGRGEAVRTISLESAATISFALSELERSLLDGRRDVTLEEWRVFWRRHGPHLARANSPAGSFGLRLIERLVTRGDRKSGEEALRLAGRILAEDWDPARRREVRK